MQNPNYNVVAITVTYNDYSYLQKALVALRRQTYPVNKIVVVDNNSSEENKSYLHQEQDDLVEILWLSKNRGGAGGFEAGMRYARETYAPDWYWLMDADAAPRPDCLEKLLESNVADENIGILAPVIFGTDLQEYQLYHHKKISKFLYHDLEKFSSYDEIPFEPVCIDADAFVGPLISQCAVETVGYVDGSLFIYGDDTEYTYRVSRKFDVKLVKAAIIDHRDQPIHGEQNPKNWWKEYYTFRNRVLFINKYKKNTMHGAICLGMLWFHLLKKIIKITISSDSAELKRIHRFYLYQGYHDGRIRKRGMTLDPVNARNEVSTVIKSKENQNKE